MMNSRHLTESKIDEQLNELGYAILPRVISPGDCEVIRNGFDDDMLYRKEIDMARYRFGSGRYKYFRYPLPDLLQSLREQVYSQVVATAQAWNLQMGIALRYPENHKEFIGICRDNGQDKPTPLILRYGQGDYNALHQDLYGAIYFPFQAIIMLSSPGIDFKGGELVLTEQRPRAQSIPRVVQPQLGDMVIIATNFRPVKGSKGFFRTAVRHGVSRVTEGTRFTAGIILHDSR